ncbi:hypothetical protein GXP67_02410 [Rhodocytophaga rosea]|uniref:Lipoprotein n=1 Tax=Rhodocytophaga rosea TaxID=2704465 RepID=A0A6C0GCL9_9BACT|nr:hypothetical protein [Rhodocytophaga rosea]QHT65594.1 hypothetical protein GXP67_02410 [Rhodocytophaga rosea]
MKTKRFFLFFLLLISTLNVILFSCQKEDEVQAASKVVDVPGAEGIYLHLEYTMGVGGFLYPEYRPYLLFKDGSIYQNLDTSIDKLDVAKSKQQEPKEWGTWEKKGNEFSITWSDGDTETWGEDEWFTTQAATAGEKIKGSYESISGGGNVAFGGDVMIFSATTISFDGDKFTYESTGGGSTSNLTAYSSQDKAGTYELKGNSIILKFNNGAVEKKFFYFYPDGKDVFGIGTRYYVPND